MDTSLHTLNTLFEQLGLPSGERDIEAFINRHKPLPASVTLSDADFWNATQAAFLQEAIDVDAEWAEPVDQLDAMLRH